VDAEIWPPSADPDVLSADAAILLVTIAIIGKLVAAPSVMAQGFPATSLLIGLGMLPRGEVG
jgi:hypothetical protein